MKRKDDFSWHSSDYYCEEHRKLQETYWKIVRNYDSNQGSLSSSTTSYDGQLTNDALSDRRRRSIVVQNGYSPVASCLKTVRTAARKSEVKKKVNFYDEEEYETTYSSSYYGLPQNNYTQRPSSRCTTNNDDSFSSPDRPRANPISSRKSNKTYNSDNEKDSLSERLSDLSLLSSSSTCCSSRKKPAPRLYKQKDSLKRAAVRRMLVYPPKGQTGQPLTLKRSWSNIDCHVNGESKNGYKYTVYYLQKFESEVWLPDDKTGSPFRRADDKCSTDYG